MNRFVSTPVLLALCGTLVAGCSDSKRRNFASVSSPVSSGSTTATTSSSAPQGFAFEVTIENLSGGSFASPFAPGVWALHDDATQLFVANAPDAGLGLEALAEDGDPAALEAALTGAPGFLEVGTFGATLPGSSTSFVFTATAAQNPRLNLATMLVASNDAFYAPDAAGVELFDANGTPQGSTLNTTLWDAGTEVDEPFGRGRHQPGRQAGPNVGPAEAVVTRATLGTRITPRATQLLDLSVRAGAAGEVIVSLTNRGASVGLVSPVAPVFFALHADGWSLFQEGAQAQTPGLETLAEDGSPAGLVSSVGADPLVGRVGAVTQTVQRPNAAPGPAMPGETFELRLTPSAGNASRLTFACMLVQSNDWFFSTRAGVALVDAAGALRPLADIESDLRAALDLFDAGTELDEVPGAGANQPPRQAAGNTGAADPDPLVRRVSDLSNDVDANNVRNLLDVQVSQAGGVFQITVTNTSGSSSYPAALTPVAWSLNDGSPAFFRDGQAASPGLEALAEDGSPAALIANLANAGAANTPIGARTPGPIANGRSYRFSVRPSANARYLHLATMIVPSNDTFVALGEGGVALLDAGGQPRDVVRIAADVRAALSAWDAGTESNEVGATGAGQPPAQAGPNTGPAAGTGLVRPFSHALWQAPSGLIRVTIRPLPR